jgi:predicted dehydrogenase
MIRVAVVGCGYWGPNLVRNVAELDSFRLTACCDVDAKRLQLIARRYPNVEITADVGILMERKDIDAVVIATPISTHHALARQALLAGKHVLLEKPMTRTVEQAEDLIAIATRLERVLLVDHVFVYAGAVQKIKQLIDGGDLGRIYYYDSVRVNLGLFQNDVNVIWDLATHDIAIFDYLVRQHPRAVSAIGLSHIGGQPENIAYITCYYPDGIIGHLHVNWLAPVKMRRILIGASRKMIVYDDLEPSEKVKVYDAGVDAIPDEDRVRQARIGYRMGDVYIPQLDRTEALRRVCEHFAHCITNRETPLTGGEAGLRVVRILEAAQRSAESRGGEIPV